MFDFLPMNVLLFVLAIVGAGLIKSAVHRRRPGQRLLEDMTTFTVGVALIFIALMKVGLLGLPASKSGTIHSPQRLSGKYSALAAMDYDLIERRMMALLG